MVVFPFGALKEFAIDFSKVSVLERQINFRNRNVILLSKQCQQLLKDCFLIYTHREKNH